MAWSKYIPLVTHHLVLGVDAVVDDGEEPGGALQCVGAARLQVKRAQTPVLQLTWKINDHVPEIIMEMFIPVLKIDLRFITVLVNEKYKVQERKKVLKCSLPRKSLGHTRSVR